MIELGAAAMIRCDAPNCRDKQPGRLVLTAQGGFAVVPQSLSWQIAIATSSGVFVARCPAHAVATEKAAAAPAEPKKLEVAK